MQIEIRYFDGCPNWQQAAEVVSELAAEMGIEVAMDFTVVDTPEAAERLAFAGSPTILLDGVDPWSDPQGPVGLGCRVYRTDTGLAGYPSRAQLRAALDAAL